MRLSSYFGNSAKFWLGLQDDYDIEEEKGEKNAPEMYLNKQVEFNNDYYADPDKKKGRGKK